MISDSIRCQGRDETAVGKGVLSTQAILQASLWRGYLNTDGHRGLGEAWSRQRAQQVQEVEASVPC